MMGHVSYASSIRVIAIILVLLPITSFCSGDFSVTVEKDFYEVYDGGGNIVYAGICSYESGNYTKGSKYQSNLLSIFSNMTTAAADPKMTFYNGTAGSGSNKVFGWFYCTDLVGCASCIRNSTKILADRCPTKTGTVFSMNDDCQVSYANISTFPDTDNTGISNCLDQTMPRMPDPVAFNRTVVMSMERLMTEVVNSIPTTNLSSSDHFADYYNPDFYIGQKVYTAVRCLPGVKRQRCKDCLLQALNDTVLNCLSIGKVSAIDFRQSCRMSYNVSASLIAPASSPLSWSPAPASCASPVLAGIPGWSDNPLWFVAPMIILYQGLQTAG